MTQNENKLSDDDIWFANRLQGNDNVWLTFNWILPKEPASGSRGSVGRQIACRANTKIVVSIPGPAIVADL